MKRVYMAMALSAVLMIGLLPGSAKAAVGGSVKITSSATQGVAGDVIDFTVSFDAYTAATLNSAGMVLQWDSYAFALDAYSGAGTLGDNDPHATAYLKGSATSNAVIHNENNRVTVLLPGSTTITGVGTFHTEGPGASDLFEIRNSNLDASTDPLFGQKDQAYVNYTLISGVSDPYTKGAFKTYPFFTVRLLVKSGAVGTKVLQAKFVGMSDDIGSKKTDYSPASMNFVIPLPTATTTASTVTATAGTVGSGASSTVTVKVTDGTNNYASQAVTLSASDPNVMITPTQVVTDANGVAVFTATSTNAASVTYTASVNGTAVSNSATQPFAAGSVSSFTVDTYTTTVPSSTATPIAFTGKLFDQYGNLLTTAATVMAISKDSYSTVNSGASNTVTTAALAKGSTATAVVDLYTTQLGQAKTQTAVIQLVPFGLDKASINLIAGENYQFALTGGTASTTWVIAQGVAGGKLSAVKGAGPVTYTAPLSGGGKVYTVTVSDAGLNATSTATIHVFNRIVFPSGAKVGLEKGKSATYGASGGALPLTYSATADPYISVTNAVTGAVSSTKVGLGTLTVTDGYTYNGATKLNTTSIMVDVVNPITITQTGMIYLDTVQNGSSNLTVSGGSGAYTYQSSNSAAVTVLNGKLTAKAAGSATITVSEKNVAYANITSATINVNVTNRLALQDPYGTALPNVLPSKVGSGKSVTMKLTGGSGSYTVSVSGPVTATISSVGDLYTFSAPTTGAFAGTYTITFTDTVTNLTRAYTVVVPYRVEVSKRTILTTDPYQLVNVYGAANGDAFTVAVLDPATKPLTAFSAAGNATPPATATVVAAVAMGVDQYAATVTVVPSKTTVTVATPVLVRVTKSGTAPQPTGSAPMVVAPAKAYTIAVTDSATGKALSGATVVLNRPADFAGSMTTDSYGKTTFNLPDAGYRFEISNGTGYLPGTVKVGFGGSNGAAALTPLTNGVTYTVTVTSPYSGVRIAAFDANNKVIQGVVNGNAATISFDPANFTMDRVMIAANGAKPVVIKAAGFTAKAATASLKGLPQITASDLGNVVQKARTLLSAGSVDPAQLTKPAGVTSIKALLKPQVGDTYTTPGTAAVALSGNRPVLQVMLNAAGAIVSAPVVYPPLSAPSDGSARTEDTGSTEPLTLGGTTATVVSMPSMAVLKNVSIRLPATAFKQGVGQVFTSISAASIDSYSTQKAKADFTGGELVEIDLTVFNVAGTDVYSTDSGNSLISGVPVTLPLDQYALIAQYNVTDAYGVKSVDSAAVIAAFANGTLAIWTASSIADFEAGVGLSQVPAADVTYNPATGEAEFTLTHFSAVGAGAGAGTTAAATAGGGGGGCVAPVTSFNQLLVFAGILFILGLMMRRRRS